MLKGGKEKSMFSIIKREELHFVKKYKSRKQKQIFKNYIIF